MRIALVSPYSWTFPGGVTRHIDELASELLAQGHHVRILSPVDPDDRVTRLIHRRSPEQVELPDHLIPLGRTAALSHERIGLEPVRVSGKRRSPPA